MSGFLSPPTERQGRMASPWEQPSSDKRQPPDLSGVERGTEWELGSPLLKSDAQTVVGGVI